MPTCQRIVSLRAVSVRELKRLLNSLTFAAARRYDLVRSETQIFPMISSRWFAWLPLAFKLFKKLVRKTNYSKSLC